jgi:hypothetical protein
MWVINRHRDSAINTNGHSTISVENKDSVWVRGKDGAGVCFAIFATFDAAQRAMVALAVASGDIVIAYTDESFVRMSADSMSEAIKQTKQLFTDDYDVKEV